jgi:hypothetical protein
VERTALLHVAQSLFHDHIPANPGGSWRQQDGQECRAVW